MTPWKVGEDVGVGISIEMLEKSIDPERNSNAYMQFDTCRNLRSVAANVYIDTSQASYPSYSTKIPKGVYHLKEGNIQTMFLESMLKGIHARISVVTSRNVLMTSIMVCYIPKVLEIKPAAPETVNYCRIPVIMTGDYLVITFG